MKTIGIRELKQNPQAVIKEVQESGEEIAVTVYGKPTDVVIRRKGPTPQRWVKGAVLNQLAEGFQDLDTEAWKADIEDSPFNEDFDDPWESRQ